MSGVHVLVNATAAPRSAMGDELATIAAAFARRAGDRPRRWSTARHRGDAVEAGGRPRRRRRRRRRDARHAPSASMARRSASCRSARAITARGSDDARGDRPRPRVDWRSAFVNNASIGCYPQLVRDATHRPCPNGWPRSPPRCGAAPDAAPPVAADLPARARDRHADAVRRQQPLSIEPGISASATRSTTGAVGLRGRVAAAAGADRLRAADAGRPRRPDRISPRSAKRDADRRRAARAHRYRARRRSRDWRCRSLRDPAGALASSRRLRGSAPPKSRAHDLDQRHPPRLPRLFRRGRAPDRAVRAAGAAERSDADVRQRRAWCRSRTSSPGWRRGPISTATSSARNACARAASTTISTMSAIPRGTTPSSRCSAISRSAIISRNRRSPTPGRC